MIPDKNFYRPDEAARLLGVHVATIRRWIKEEKMITHKTIGGHNRIHRAEIERLRAARSPV